MWNYFFKVAKKDGVILEYCMYVMYVYVGKCMSVYVCMYVCMAHGRVVRMAMFCPCDLGSNPTKVSLSGMRILD